MNVQIPEQSSVYGTRLVELRGELVRRNLAGFIVPLTDEHLSEYVGSYAQRLAWLTGFKGSAGWAAVLLKEAALFVDGRYTVQVRQEVDRQDYSLQSVPQTSVGVWLAERALSGDRIGYDPWLHTKRWVTATGAQLADRGAKLIAVDTNPVDAVWHDRPAPSRARVEVHPESLAGLSSAEKRRDIVSRLRLDSADAVVLTALDSIAWTFNIRGHDILHTPVARCCALVWADETADLFVDPEKLTEEVIKHLGGAVRLHAMSAFAGHLRTLTNRRIAVDPTRTVAAVISALEDAGAAVVDARDPTVLPKAIKNPVEIAGHRAAQARDGAALTRFLHWLSTEAVTGKETELSAARKVRQFREYTGQLRDLSFDTISAAGPNGALPHYGLTERSNRAIERESLYLIDSGGQYLDGTTDVTRTIAIGTPTAEMRDRFTRVLKGHIAFATAIFPAGTRGVQLDALARQFLWAAGLDYQHGTGHGVGCYLSVHEGPQRIANTSAGTGDLNEPLVAGMILSNEPGYYKDGAFGIRIENLVLTVKRDISGAEQEMLGFETLTLAPIDRSLIEVGSLTKDEVEWVDTYHSEVLKRIGPQLKGDELAWLSQATRPLTLDAP